MSDVLNWRLPSPPEPAAAPPRAAALQRRARKPAPRKQRAAAAEPAHMLETLVAAVTAGVLKALEPQLNQLRRELRHGLADIALRPRRMHRE